MFEILRIIIALFGSTFAGLWDLKTSDVPDSVCIAMIGVGFALNTAQGFMTGDFSLLIDSLIFGGIFLAFGALMYFMGQWGGGDGEILLSIAVLLPTLSIVHTVLPFSLSFFFNSLIIGAVYSVIYAMIFAFRNKKTINRFVSEFKRDRVTQFTMLIIIVLILVTIYLKFIPMFTFMLSLLLVLTFFYKFAKMVEQDFSFKIPVSKLKKGDIIGEDIPKLGIFKKQIRGLTEKEIKMIKRTKRYVVIRTGVRYGPVFFITLIITLLFGDLFLAFL